MKNIQEQLKRGQKISMNSNEKGLIRATLLRTINNSSVVIKKATSPYIKNILVTMKKSVVSPFSFHSFVKVTALTLIILIGGGASLSFASEKTLPGETLYNFKISVSEPVREALAFNKQNKAFIQAKRIVARVDEIKALKEGGILTEEKSAMVKNLIEEQSASFIETATELTNEGYSDAVVETTSILLDSLNDYSENVKEEEKILDTEATKLENGNPVVTLMKTENLKTTKVEDDSSFKKIEKEIVFTTTDISAVIGAVKKSIENKLPEVVETIKEQEKQTQKESTVNEISEKTSDANYILNQKQKICEIIATTLSEAEILKAETLTVKNSIDTKNLVLTGTSENEGVIVLSYENIVSGIKIYENNISYLFTNSVLIQTIGTPYQKYLSRKKN